MFFVFRHQNAIAGQLLPYWFTLSRQDAGGNPFAFQEFLQGVVTTSTSGGQLKPYFLQKAEQFEKEYKLDMRSQLETLGLMAESFVTVVVAFPLFLVVIMAIMAIVPSGAGSGDMTVTLLYLVVFMMIPISQFGFIFFIWNMTKESQI